MRSNDLPLFDALGRDLLVIHPVRRAVSLAMPFVVAIAFFVFAAYGRWAEAIASWEAIVVVVALVASIVAARWTIAPAFYAALVGRVLSLVAVEHLYHLEHHLYPQVPHHNWPELGRRLDPYFAAARLRPVRLFF